jgi:stringent starvation protein B
MKYVISFTARAGGSSAEIETGVERALAVFSKWTPPADQNITEFVNRIHGRRDR